jgi:glycosyltransferase involved in cell wall biosynthesis
MLKQYGRSLIAVEKRIFASVFCDDYDHFGAKHSYAQKYFVDCWKFLQGVMCDTLWYPEDLVRHYGVSSDKFTTVYFPVSIDSAPVYRSVTVPRVLWAGRFCRQKRVDLLIDIARLLPDVIFDAYGYASNEFERELEARMREVPNIKVHGAFESFNSLVETDAYSLFLFTSGWEGLPITLLDVTIAGLPIVASVVGGVPEFISEETGYPVREIDDSRAYAERIHEAMVDDFTRHQKWKSAAELVMTRHTVEYFSQQLKCVNGYLNAI